MDYYRETKRQGMSCSTSCCYKNHVECGVIPLDYLPDSAYELQEQNNIVMIGESEFNLVRCFHRTIPIGNITVGQALITIGDHESCQIDDNFVIYFETTDHALIRLRHKTVAEATNMEFDTNNTMVTFRNLFFNLDPWVECPTKFVRVAPAIMTAVLSGKSVSEISHKIKEGLRPFLML